MNAGFMPVINKSDLIVPIELITQCEHFHVLADILHPINSVHNKPELNALQAGNQHSFGSWLDACYFELRQRFLK